MITGQKDLPRPPRKENNNVQKNVNIVKIWYYISLLRQIITKKKTPNKKPENSLNVMNIYGEKINL